ncbi:MAG TPA: formyltetrahydrofolate deformylase [Opitutales bacterium]|nr:formyltetrahydrofolate deformylase [Opitutales bacterium]
MSASPPATNLTALLSGPDRPGLVARVATWIFERGGNILHADQHNDESENAFFQRVEWLPAAKSDPAAEAREFEAYAAKQLGMDARVARSSERPKVAIFASKADHCFHDLILRFRAGEMHGELACVIANHDDLASAAKAYGLPFFHTPVTPTTKSAVEKEQLKILRDHGVALAVLARYMQILSPEFLGAVGVPIINIHHSFLPAFAGGKPYHQAYARGVKLVGATAHYVTPKLDEGPIIAQDVARVSHRHNIDDLQRRGRDLEKVVLAQAVRWHLENRIIVHGNKTMVFD